MVIARGSHCFDSMGETHTKRLQQDVRVLRVQSKREWGASLKPAARAHALLIGILKS